MAGNDRQLVPFTRVDRVRETATGLLAELHGEFLAIDVVAADVVRLRISRGGVFQDRPTHAVCIDPLAASDVLEVTQDPGCYQVRTPAMVVSLWLDPFRVEVHRADGSPVLRPTQDEQGRWWTFATLNDAFEVRRAAQAEDAVYGLGEKTGGHNRRGRSFTLWNTDVLDPRASGEFSAGLDPDDPRADPRGTEFDPYYVSIPFFHHLDAATAKMSASFLDNGYRGHYDFTRPGELRIRFDGGQYCEYVFTGPRMPEILARYTWLTGRMELPPIWALGYHQCRWHPYRQADVERLGAAFRDAGIPCDVLWLDIDHMAGYRVFTWDVERFPDVAGMLDRMAGIGLRVVTIVDPGVKYEPGYWVYDQAAEAGLLCRTEAGGTYLGQVWPGLTAFPDFAREETRQWWGSLNAAHIRSGLAGIWNDMNEPATGAIEPEAMFFDSGRASHERYHNQYALLMAMGTVSGLRQARPGDRTFVLSRAGSAGIQRYAANWMGDNMARWDHLALSVAMGNGLGVSGQPFVGADIGGFMGDTTEELLTRWTQYAAFTPFCRNHSAAGSIDQYPWSFGPAAQERIRTAIRGRYRLLPYIYTAFVTAHLTGAPVARPLVFDHQDDPSVRDIDDEFLLGPDLLVAPITAPGATGRAVRLPAGQWYDWHTGSAVPDRDVAAGAPADRIPVFARAGAIIPMWPQAPDSTWGYHPDVIELHVFVPGHDGEHTSVLQEDDGLGIDPDAALHTTFQLRRSGDHLEVLASVRGAGYPQFARTAFDVVFHGGVPGAARADGRALDCSGARAHVPNRGTGFHLQVQLEA